MRWLAYTGSPMLLTDVDARLLVSEPIGDLPGAFAELPEASYAVADTGREQLLPFTPNRRSPVTAVR